MIQDKLTNFKGHKIVKYSNDTKYYCTTCYTNYRDYLNALTGKKCTGNLKTKKIKELVT